MQPAKHIANVALALLILMSSTGVTLHKHHCMGDVRNVALMHKADSCMGELGQDMPMGCCKDTVEEFKVEELNKANFGLDLTPELFLVAVINSYLYEINLEANPSVQTAFLNYKPPLIERDITIDVQSFLI